jgi:hypothetical protein
MPVTMRVMAVEMMNLHFKDYMQAWETLIATDAVEIGKEKRKPTASI